MDNLNARVLCRNISVLADEVVESVEVFVLVINTSDPSVDITQPNVTVSIEDSSSKFIFLVYIFLCELNV